MQSRSIRLVHPARELTMEQRLAPRVRPGGFPVLRQSWGNTLFLHWPVSLDRLRRHVPAELTIDTYEGDAFVGIVPFTAWGLRPPLGPAIPVIGRMQEINLRTYVVHDGVPGVWFLSIDANNPLAVVAARLLYHLPYHLAKISRRARAGTLTMKSTRLTGPHPAELSLRFRPGDRLPLADPRSLEFFLTERYYLYSTDGTTIFRGRIHHRPWRLASAQLDDLRSSVCDALGMPEPREEPIVHYAERQDASIWPLERIAELIATPEIEAEASPAV